MKSKQFSRCIRYGMALVLGFAVLSPACRVWAQTGNRKFLHSHVPAAVANLQSSGRLQADQQLRLAIGLPLRNTAALTNLLADIYNPASLNYRHYLTPQEFTASFGPTEEDYQKVKDFATEQGFTLTATHPNRVLLDVSAKVSAIERAFRVTLRVYPHPKEPRTFFAPDTEPSVGEGLPILDITGLNNYALPHPKNLAMSPLTRSANGVRPNSGSGPNGNYRGNDFRAAYAPGAALTGTGQTVGLLEFEGYYKADITKYENQAGLAHVTLQNVLVDGFNGTPSTDANAVAEVSLDIEMAISMAPGLSRVVVFEAGPNGYQNDLLNAMASSNTISCLSCSWGWGGGPQLSTDQIFQQMAAQGQTFFNASGDSDAFSPGAVDDATQQNAPSSSPYIIQVGGTTLNTTGPGGSWVSETTWNRGGGTGSSGGISSFYLIPAWQQGIDMTANAGSTTMRNIPDVALTAENVYVTYDNGQSGAFGGTSCAAPLWAGFTALINQQAVANGQPVVGFINPALYGLARGPNYTACLHDITTGDNSNSGTGASFPAVTGYDLCTGWGTPTGTNLINALATPEPLKATPVNGFTSAGPVGGPFNITSQDIILSNSTATSLTWALANLPSWLGASASGGALTGNGQTTMTISLNSNASSLAAGIYNTILSLSDVNTGYANSIPITLLVGQPVVLNGGFETGDFSFWSLNAGGFVIVDDGTSTGLTPHSGTYFAALGQSGSLGFLSQTLSTVQNQPYLLSFWLNSPDGQTPNQFLASWNGTTLFNRTNLGILGWTNLQYLVVATNKSSVLEFGFRDDPTNLGLDDVTVTPIPQPQFTAVVKTNTTVHFKWNTVAGFSYQLQYKTNLLGTVWSNLGSPIMATSGTLTATDGSATSSQRFYRLQLLH